MAKGTVNKVILIGRLGADPDVRSISNGGSVANFNVATIDSVKKGDSYEEVTEWTRVVAWGKLAEIASKYLKKGSQVYIEGSLKTRQWEDDKGNKRYVTEVVAREMQFIGGNGGSTDGSSQQSSGGSSRGGGKKSGSFDDVPF